MQIIYTIPDADRKSIFVETGEYVPSYNYLRIPPASVSQDVRAVYADHATEGKMTLPDQDHILGLDEVSAVILATPSLNKIATTEPPLSSEELAILRRLIANIR